MPVNRKPGRQTLYTTERIKIILETIETGGSDADACALAGINEATFYRWMNGKSDFCNDVTSARVRGKMSRVKRIKQAGAEDWRADAWYLERRWPHEYAQQLIVKVTAEQAALLKQYGFTPAQAFEAMINEFADAKRTAD